MYADEFLLNLNKVALHNKAMLPVDSGIYFVIDAHQVIWYIGRSININKRWNSERPHHRFAQLQSLSSQQQFFIYYYQVAQKLLYIQEKRFIAKYKPLLNFTSIEKNFNSNRQFHIGYNRNKISEFRQELDASRLSELEKQENQQIRSKYADYFILNKQDMNYGCDDRQEDLAISQVEIMPPQLQSIPTVPIKQFKRKFISLIDEEINLNFEIEICIDQKNKAFVRHHVFTFIWGSGIGIISNNVGKRPEDYIQDIDERCKKLLKPFRWIGYKFCCEDIILLDEEDDFEMEIQAIMLPCRMFVDLMEDIWYKNTDLCSKAQEQDNSWVKNMYLYCKIYKYLFDRNTTLRNSLELS